MTMSEDLSVYLRATSTIDADHEAIREKASELCAPCPADPERARALFLFVRDQIHYNVYMISTFLEDFRASTILERGVGYCVQKAVLLAALGRAVGIPSRLVFAKIRNHRAPAELRSQTGIDVLPSHGYMQFFIKDRWVNATPAFDRSLCERIGVPVCDFDGYHDAILADRDLTGKPYIEYVEKYEPQADLPFEWLRARIAAIWGEKRAWLSPADSKGHVMPSGYVFPR